MIFLFYNDHSLKAITYKSWRLSAFWYFWRRKKLLWQLESPYSTSHGPLNQYFFQL